MLAHLQDYLILAMGVAFKNQYFAEITPDPSVGAIYVRENM